MSANSNNNLLVLLKKIEQQDPENALLAELYKRHGKKDIESLITDLRKDASNTIGSLLTGPVDYDECVKRVAKKLNIDENHMRDDEVHNELLILQAALKAAYEKLSPEEREAKLKELNEELKGNVDQV